MRTIGANMKISRWTHERFLKICCDRRGTGGRKPLAPLFLYFWKVTVLFRRG